MIFASPIFLFWFLPFVLLVYYLLPMRRVETLDPVVPKSLAALPRWLFSKSGWLTVASFVFYAWWKPKYVPLMLVSALIDYYVGLALGREERAGRRKLLLVVSCVTNLGLLGWFKYANLFVASFGTVLGDGAPPWVKTWEAVVLPVGISFYTFQSMSYTIDVYRRELKPIGNVGDFLCYVALFPQLVAGPIVRYADVAAQIQERDHSVAKFATGAFLFMTGFAKKILLADVVAPAANALFGAPAAQGAAADALAAPTALEAWTGTLAYTFQIYFDFSGYSDMAVGLGLMLGFVFPVNFDAPYKSASVTEFWRRWHMTLSTWLRDYLYVPLGGNRRGEGRTYFNLAATMLLGGLWHGASWTFLAWGAYQGFWLIVERAAGRKPLYAALPRGAQVALTFVLTMGGWILFRAASFEDAARVYAGLCGVHGFGGDLYRLGFGGDTLSAWGLAACAFVAFACRTSQAQAREPSRVAAAFVPLAFLVATLHMFFQSYSPFLYFQF